MSTNIPFKEFTTGVGRFIGGGLTMRQDVDYRTKQPKFDKDGKPIMKCAFGVAFPKIGPYGAGGAVVQTTHWSQIPWAAGIREVGYATHGAVADRPDYSWKVTDGDSAVPNKAGKLPKDQEGQPGHWIFWFSSMNSAPGCRSANGKLMVAPETIKLGHFIQVQASVKGNTGETPGVYLNHHNVAHAAYGPEIFTGPDAEQAGFGVGVHLPAGASATPVGGMAPTGAAPPPAIVHTPPPPTAVAPAPASVLAPPVGAAPAPPPPAAPVKQLTAKAGTATYESFIAQGWTDDLMRAQGYLV